MTRDRAKEIIDSMEDDTLIDIATTCSNRGVALRAEVQLRRRAAVCGECGARMSRIARLRKRDGDLCWICKRPMDFSTPRRERAESSSRPTVDHVVELRWTVDDELANLKLAHWSCNNGRSNPRSNELSRWFDEGGR